jgi:hypothetical protein
MQGMRVIVSHRAAAIRSWHLTRILDAKRGHRAAIFRGGIAHGWLPSNAPRGRCGLQRSLQGSQPPGTPGGVGSRRTPPIWMKAGDVVEVEIDKVGLLRNGIADEA